VLYADAISAFGTPLKFDCFTEVPSYLNAHPFFKNLVSHVSELGQLAWPKGYLGKLLKNPFYHGTMIIKGKSYPHRYPPIISKSLFDQVHTVKERFKKKSFKFAGLPFHYRGLIRCSDCGLSISPERHKGYAYYHCTEYKGKHGAKWIREEDITEQLATVFKSIQMPKDMLEQTVETLSEVHKNKIKFHTDHFNKVTKEQKKLSKMMDTLYLDRLQGKINDEQYDRFYEKFVQQKEETTAQINHLQEAENNYYLTAKYVLNLADHAYDLFMSSEVEEKRQLITLVLQNVKMDGKKIVWDVQKPFDLMIEAGSGEDWRQTRGTLRTFRWTNIKEQLKFIQNKSI